MMTKCNCRNGCDEYFDFTTATKNGNKWVAICPHCKTPVEIDVEDYLVEIGYTVTLVNGESGTITGYIMDRAETFDDIIYIVDRGPGKSDCHAKRCCFKLETTWKKLRPIPGGGLDRVCHYTRNQAYSNVPCYNCVDRTKCNADIFDALATYESSDFKPDEVVAIRSEMLRSGMTLEELMTYLRSKT